MNVVGSTIGADVSIDGDISANVVGSSIGSDVCMNAADVSISTVGSIGNDISMGAGVGVSTSGSGAKTIGGKLAKYTCDRVYKLLE